MNGCGKCTYVFLRPILYLIVIDLIVLSLGLLANKAFTGSWYSSAVPAPSTKNHTTLNSILISPLVETMLVLMVWIQINMSLSISIKYRSYTFIITISFISLIIHGCNFLSLFSSIMFCLTSIFIIRSSIVYRMSYFYICIGCYVIHALYNFPYIMHFYKI